MVEKNYVSKTVLHLVMIVIMLLCVAPFMLIVSTALSDEETILKFGYSIIPRKFSLDAFVYILRNPKQILDAYKLTIIVVAIGTTVGTVLMTAYAYSISREDYILKNFLSFYVYFTMLFSGGMVSSYIWISRYLKLSNTIWALILPNMMSAFNIFILRTACKSIPKELIESATLDGAGEVRIFIEIVIPLAKTGIATIALLLLFAYWNEWFLSMMYMDSGNKTTLQYYLVKVLDSVEFAKANAGASGGLLGADLPQESVRMAICVFAAGPMLIVFPFFQKYFVKGITVGAVKG